MPIKLELNNREAPAPTEAQRAFMHELEALNGGPKSFAKGAPPGALHAIGRRWAEYPEPDPELLPELPPAVLHDLTKGEYGVLHPADEGAEYSHAKSWAIMAAHRINEGAGERLAERYLEETGLSARIAAYVLWLLEGHRRTTFDMGRLSPEERVAMEDARQQLEKLQRQAHRVLFPNLIESDEEVEEPTSEDAALLRELWEAEDPGPDGRKVLRWYAEPDRGIHTGLPSAADAVATYRRLAEKSRMTPEDIEAAAAKLLGGHPDPLAWVDATGWKKIRGVMTAHLDKMARRQAEQELEEERKRREEAERRADEAEAETRRVQTFFRARGMPEHTRYPQMLIDNALATRKDWGRQLDFLEQQERRGKLNPEDTPTPTQRALLEEQARLDTNPEHWDLTTPEWRLLHAVYTLYTSLGRDGETYAGRYIPEDWPALYAAAGLPENESGRGKLGDFSLKRRTELQNAMTALAKDPQTPGSGREVPVMISRKRPDRKGKKGAATWTVLAESVHILKRVPIWEGLSEEEAEELRNDPVEHWPEPTGWALELPGALRMGLDNYFRLMPSDLPARLEAAAKAVQPKGKGAGVQPRDWVFTLWLYKQRPTRRDGCLFLYVDRAELARRVPALRTYLESRQKARLVQYTEQVYKTAQKADLLVNYQLDELRSEGLRDVLELNPAMFPNGGARGALPVTDRG